MAEDIFYPFIFNKIIKKAQPDFFDCAFLCDLILFNSLCKRFAASGIYRLLPAAREPICMG